MTLKTKRKPKLFTAELTELPTRKKIKGFTHAYSFSQAMRNLGMRHPNTLIDKVTDTVTNVSFTRQQWIEATKYKRDN